MRFPFIVFFQHNYIFISRFNVHKCTSDMCFNEIHQSSIKTSQTVFSFNPKSVDADTAVVVLTWSVLC